MMAIISSNQGPFRGLRQYGFNKNSKEICSTGNPKHSLIDWSENTRPSLQDIKDPAVTSGNPIHYEVIRPVCHNM
jgi:hypothetical protein